jgi:Ca2+-binding RTX toxin-like protein
MRRAVLLLVVTAVVLALAAEVASAVNKSCFGSTLGALTPDCVGTREADTLTAGDGNYHRIAAMEGNDIITGGESQDDIYGDEGNDTITDNENNIGDIDFIYGDEGNDTIDVQEGGSNHADTVNCGPGKKDRVFFDQGGVGVADTVTGCEIKNPGQ